MIKAKKKVTLNSCKVTLQDILKSYCLQLTHILARLSDSSSPLEETTLPSGEVFYEDPHFEFKTSISELLNLLSRAIEKKEEPLDIKVVGNFKGRFLKLYGDHCFDLGCEFSRIQRYDHALKFFKLALMYSSLFSIETLSDLKQNYGVCALREKQYVESAKYLEESYQLFNLLKKDDEKNLADLLLGVAYYKAGNFENAVLSFQRVLEVFGTLKNVKDVKRAMRIICAYSKDILPEQDVVDINSDDSPQAKAFAYLQKIGGLINSAVTKLSLPNKLVYEANFEVQDIRKLHQAPIAICENLEILIYSQIKNKNSKALVKYQTNLALPLLGVEQSCVPQDQKEKLSFPS